jgi:hypothetical protein
MRWKVWCAAMLLAAAAGTAIWAAPAALAQSDDQPSCTDVAGSETECQSPGNVEINASPPVEYAPQYPYWEGDSIIDEHDGGGGLVGLEPPHR